MTVVPHANIPPERTQDGCLEAFYEDAMAVLWQCYGSKLWVDHVEP